jgi:hypothetical protein
MRRIMQEEMEEFDKRMREREQQREREDWERRNPQGFPFPRKQKPGQPLLPPLPPREDWEKRNPRGIPVPRKPKPGEPLLPPLPPRSDGKSNFVSPRNKDVFKIMKYFRF